MSADRLLRWSLGWIFVLASITVAWDQATVIRASRASETMFGLILILGAPGSFLLSVLIGLMTAMGHTPGLTIQYFGYLLCLVLNLVLVTALLVRGSRRSRMMFAALGSAALITAGVSRIVVAS